MRRPQSFRRNWTAPRPVPSRSAAAVILRIASALGSPLKGPESTSTPYAAAAASSSAPDNAGAPAGCTTTRTGRSYLRQNSKSR